MNKLIIILIILFFSGYLLGQSKNSAFNNSSFTISYIKTSEHNGLDTYWNIENGFGGYFQTQFYIGDISLGISHTSFEGHREKYPNFSSNFIYLGWIGNLNLPLNTSLGIGVKVGSYLMTFEGDTFNSFQKNESELAMGPFVVFSFPVLSSISLKLSSEYIIVYTKRSMKFFNLSAGISYTFTTPNWLKRIFE